MEEYNLRLDKEVFPKWKAELKEKEEAPLLDTNREPIFTCDGIMWKITCQRRNYTIAGRNLIDVFYSY